MYFFDFFINNGRICMGFFADNLKKRYKKQISKWFSRKINDSKVIKDQLVFLPFARQLFCQTFFRKSYKISKFLYFFYSICFKPHANQTIINENIKEIHILTVGGIQEFPILNDMLLCRDLGTWYTTTWHHH